MKNRTVPLFSVLFVSVHCLSSLMMVAEAQEPDTSARPPREKRDIILFKEPLRYGGWPANHGIWAWGNELVVGFTEGWYKSDATGHAIMPSSLRRKGNTVLTTIRRRDPDKSAFIEAWRSEDLGASWKLLGIPAPEIGGGNPPSLVALPASCFALCFSRWPSPARTNLSPPFPVPRERGPLQGADAAARSFT